MFIKVVTVVLITLLSGCATLSTLVESKEDRQTREAHEKDTKKFENWLSYLEREPLQARTRATLSLSKGLKMNLCDRVTMRIVRLRRH